MSTFTLTEGKKIKNDIFEKHKFQMKLISLWFISKMNIKIYKRIYLELPAWTSLVSCSDVKSKQPRNGTHLEMSKLYISTFIFILVSTKKKHNIIMIIHCSCLFALLAKIKYEK